MRLRNRNRRLAAAALMVWASAWLVGGGPAAGGPAAAGAVEGGTVVFLVRHAEKLDASDDPPLTAAGEDRADLLARMLRDAGIDRIHSSDFIRTRDTAGPIAEALGIEVEIYDPRDLEGLAERLASGPRGRHLVVGHSNTTTVVVELLGGEPGSEIDDATEYDRLYVVTIGAAGDVSTTLMRFGEPSTAATSASH